MIENLDTAARAAGFAMAGSDDATVQRDRAASAPSPMSADQAYAWLRQMGNLKNPLPGISGWTPWKATA
jgi:hypothetical protein